LASCGRKTNSAGAPGGNEQVTRLLVHVEGQTEEHFVNSVLRDHLVSRGYSLVAPRLMGNARQRSQRGGVRSWDSVKSEIVRHLKEDIGRRVTTMVDFYGLPFSWPGRQAASTLPHGDKAIAVEAELLNSVVAEMGTGFDPSRFVPFVIMHEFEGLLFSDCDTFATEIGRSDITHDLQTIRDQFTTPEEINDSSETAPSKRVLELMPEYEKPLHGNLAAMAIGLDRMCVECPHFRGWVERLEVTES